MSRATPTLGRMGACAGRSQLLSLLLRQFEDVLPGFFGGPQWDGAPVAHSGGGKLMLPVLVLPLPVSCPLFHHSGGKNPTSNVNREN